MRILLITHYYSTHGGGIEIVAGTLAMMLARAHEVVWAASDCDAVPPTVVGSLRCAPMRAANLIEKYTGLPLPIWGPGSLLTLWRETGHADIVHLHDVMYLGNCAAFVFAVLRGKPLFVTQHVGFIPYRNLILRLALRALHASIGRIMLGRADQVVFVSRLVRDYYARFVRFRRPPLVVDNGVDGRTFVPSSPGGRVRVRTEIGIDPTRPLLLFVGRFVEKKGLHILERLAGRLTEVSWVFAGWGPLDPRAWKYPHVHVFGNRHGASLVPLYQAADLLVLPSVGEGLPLVLQESMSCGTPVMVGEDTAEAVGTAPGFVFAEKVGGPATADAWEAELRRILPDILRSDRQNAIAAFARSRWSWDACADTYESLFRQLIGIRAAEG